MPYLTTLKKYLSESYLILSVLYYWIMTTTLFNHFALGLLVVMLLLIWSKNRVLGVSIAIVFLLLNIFMILALVSELREFPTADKDFFIMLFVGLFYFGLNITVAVLMLVKWYGFENRDTKDYYHC